MRFFKNLAAFTVIFSLYASSAVAMDRELASYYALTLMSSLQAQKHCSGMARDDGRFAFLLSKVGQRPEDNAAMDAQLKQAAIDVRDGLAKVGVAEWCSNIWRLFGPDGTGLIKRQ